jgi:PKD repeat protein
MTMSILIEVSDKSKSGHILTANAGEDQTVYEGDIVQFNCSVSSETFFPVWPVDISGDGQYMAIGWDKYVTFFSTASNIPLWTYNTGGRVGDLKLSEDGRYLAVGSFETLFFFNTTTSIPLWSDHIGGGSIRFDSDPGNRLDMTRDGKYVGAAAVGNRFLVYNTTSSTPTIPYWDYGFGDIIYTIRFSGDGRYIGIGSHDNGIYQLGWVPDRTINWSASPGGRFYSSSISYNGNRISTGQGNNNDNIKLFDCNSNIPLWEYRLRDGMIFEQVISDDGRYFVSTNRFAGGIDAWNGFALWNTTLPDPIWTYPTGIVTDTIADALDMDRSANYVVGGSRNKNIYLFHQLADGYPDWDLLDSTPVFTYQTGGRIDCNGVSISADGTYFAAGSWDSNVYLFSTVGGPHLVWNYSTTSFFQDPSYSYKWDLNNFVDSDGDGDFENDVDATIPNPTYVYGDNGVYTIKLTIEDNYGGLDVDSVIITVKNTKPTIEPFGPITIEKDKKLTFYGNVSDPGSDDLTFTWNWDDGTGDNVTIHYNNGSIPDPYPSPDVKPMDISDTVNHSFSDYGVYEVTLTVEDDDGGISQYKINVSVIEGIIGPPTLYIYVSPDGRDITLNWDPPPNLDVDYYLIYRSTSQTEFDFDSVWINTSLDNETGEPGQIPLRTMWNDTNAAVPDDPNYSEQYYYIIKAVDTFDEVGTTSRTVGKWTKVFQKGNSTFSLPLEPLDILYTDNLTTNMNADYIKYMDNITHTWRQHNFGDGSTNNTQMRQGEGYEVKFSSQTNYTFTGFPGSMISHKDIGFDGFDPKSEAKNITVQIESNGNVNISWEESSSMGTGDWYEVYYSNSRDGFFRTLGEDYFPLGSKIYFGNNTVVHNAALAGDPGARLFYMVVPFNANGTRGSSTYSIGIWTEEYWGGYDTIGIPLKTGNNHTADWYCDNIPDTIGINYFNFGYQEWEWHSKRMPSIAFDPILEITSGYQISTSGLSKFTFIGT